MANDVTLHGPIGELARQFSPADRLRAEEIYAAMLSLWSAAIAPTVKIASMGRLRPVLVWTAFAGNSDGTTPLHDAAARALDSKGTFTTLCDHSDISAEKQVVRAVVGDRKRSSASGTPSTLLTGTPFYWTPGGRCKFRDGLDSTLRKPWDGTEFLPVEDQQDRTPPMVGILWEVRDQDWRGGSPYLSDNLYTRILPFKVRGTGLLAPTPKPEQQSPLAEAYRWATAEPRQLQLDDAARRKWHAIRHGESALSEALTGRRADAFCVRLGEHTLRVAAALAAAEKSTVIRRATVEAAWTLVCRSIRDTFDLTQDVDGAIEDVLTQLDDSICAADGTGEVAGAPLQHLEETLAVDTADTPSRRRAAVVQTLERDNRLKRQVKRWYGDVCQICRTVLRIPSPAGTYSEAAHIQALGAPHHGPDRIENLLCLCPNCHVLFDNGALYLTDELRVTNAIDGRDIGPLEVHPRHRIGQPYICQHRKRWGISG